MPSSASRPLISQLRASTRLVVWVLLLFVMKIGMVAACTVHDLDDLSQPDQATSLGVAVADAGAVFGQGDSTDPTQHPGCNDCNCHHAAALLPQAVAIEVPAGRSEPTRLFLHVHHAAPRRELRPPIA